MLRSCHCRSWDACGFATSACNQNTCWCVAVYDIYGENGPSEDNYIGTAVSLLFGSGQGSGASPAVWLSLVVILLQTLDRLIPDQVNFSSLSGDTVHTRLSDAFVNNASLSFTSSSDYSYIDDLITRLEKVAQTWEHLLYLSCWRKRPIFFRLAPCRHAYLRRTYAFSIELPMCLPWGTAWHQLPLMKRSWVKYSLVSFRPSCRNWTSTAQHKHPSDTDLGSLEVLIFMTYAQKWE